MAYNTDDGAVKTPLVDDHLIAYLENMFPDRCPSPSLTDREVWMNVGKVAVVQHLRRIHKEQRENMLSSN